MRQRDVSHDSIAAVDLPFKGDVRGCEVARSGCAAVPADAVGERCREDDARFGVRAARGAAPSPRGRAEHPRRADRRRGSRAPQHAGWRGRDEDDGPGQVGGNRVQPVPHHRDVLADPRVAAVGAQPPPCRLRADRRAGERLGRLLGSHSQEQRARSRGAEGLRLQHRRVWQVAQHPCRGDDSCRAVRELADGCRLRVLLRVPGG